MFQRKPLRDDVGREILARIVDGRLPAGKRINESHLSERLGISRTPLREAMLTLSASGFLGSDMGRGFRVPALDAAEFGNILQVLTQLEPYALSHCQRPDPGRIMEMNNQLNRARMGIDKPGTIADLVTAFAALSMAGAGNPVLLKDIARLENLARRYWFAAVSRGFDGILLVDSFARIYELLRVGSCNEAANAWRDHLQQIAPPAVKAIAAKAVASSS